MFFPFFPSKPVSDTNLTVSENFKSFTFPTIATANHVQNYSYSYVYYSITFSWIPFALLVSLYSYWSCWNNPLKMMNKIRSLWCPYSSIVSHNLGPM